MFEYECPICGNDLYGSFVDDVYCNVCDRTFETDYDCNEVGYTSWIVGG